MPESNIDNVANNLWSRSIDLTGQGFVEVLQTLVRRAEEIRRRRKRRHWKRARNGWTTLIA